MEGLDKGRRIQGDRGSVMLEFVLVLPILLLMFGSTMLTYDLTMANMKLLVANRNLSWLKDDRQAGDNIDQDLEKTCSEDFDARNKLEKAFSGGAGGDFWDMGSSGDNWGRDVGSISLDGVAELDASNGWGSLFSGNMELKMTRLSGVYIGAIGLSSVLSPMDEKEHYYNAKYNMTRAVGDSDDPAEINPEALLYKRLDDDSRMTDHYVLEAYKIALQSWPRGSLSIGGLASAYTDSDSLGNGSITDMGLSMPMIGHFRALVLLSGDNDLLDTLQSIISGIQNIFSGFSELMSKELDIL